MQAYDIALWATLWITTENFNPTQPNALYMHVYMCVKIWSLWTKGLKQCSRCQLWTKTMVGTLNHNITYLNQFVPVKYTQASNVYSKRDHICLFCGRLSLFVFPPFKYAPVSQSMSLRLKLSYLWYGDRIGKNLTQFLQGLVLELLKIVFKVAYKWMRIFAWYLRLKTRDGNPFWLWNHNLRLLTLGASS